MSSNLIGNFCGRSSFRATHKLGFSIGNHSKKWWNSNERRLECKSCNKSLKPNKQALNAKLSRHIFQETAIMMHVSQQLKFLVYTPFKLRDEVDCRQTPLFAFTEPPPPTANKLGPCKRDDVVECSAAAMSNIGESNFSLYFHGTCWRETVTRWMYTLDFLRWTAPALSPTKSVENGTSPWIITAVYVELNKV